LTGGADECAQVVSCPGETPYRPSRRSPTSSRRCGWRLIRNPPIGLELRVGLERGHGALLALTSGPPWHLSCVIESVGPDCLCRIQGGEGHIGAVVLCQWCSDGVVTERLTAEGHKETPIATHAAREICRVWRRSVVCIAGIHFDGIDRAQIEEIVRTANELTRRAAGEIASRLHR